MKNVIAYNCGFCGKLYDSPTSCKKHENRCYFNPKTKSCASCAFLKYETLTYCPNHIISFQSCLNNYPIGNYRLRTKCDKYLDKKYREDSDIMEYVYKQYDLEKNLYEAVASLTKNESKLRDEE
jgi:hypothetical protein